mmetsp:Transcript_17504/g.44785  ORF Transcript_17504/g.44785 Transcript_17504/m.44785 type:complete len:348 (+) Transcript_17504:77-1120(+)
MNSNGSRPGSSSSGPPLQPLATPRLSHADAGWYAPWPAAAPLPSRAGAPLWALPRWPSSTVGVDESWRCAHRFRSLLLLGAVLCNHHGVVSLVGLERDLLERLEVFLFQALHLFGEYGLGRGGRVDAVGLDRDDAVPLVLEEEVRVERYDARLVRLRHIGEDNVDHSDQHAVLQRVARVLDDGDHVGPLLGHVDQVAAGAVRELDRVDNARLADNVGDVRDGGARGGTEVEDLGTRLDPKVVHATQHSGGELGAEGVPHAVLRLYVVLLDGNALLTVDRLARHGVLGAKRVLVAARDEDAGEAVRLDDDLLATLHASATAAAAPAAAAAIAEKPPLGAAPAPMGYSM